MKQAKTSVRAFLLLCLLAAIFSASIVSAKELSTYSYIENHNDILKRLSGDGPDYLIVKGQILVESSLWQKTKTYSSEAWQETIDFSNEAWESTQIFVEKDENKAWTYITTGGAGMSLIGASAFTTTSLLGVATLTTAPAWAPVALCAGGAIAVAGATHLAWENLND